MRHQPPTETRHIEAPETPEIPLKSLVLDRGTQQNKNRQLGDFLVSPPAIDKIKVWVYNRGRENKKSLLFY